MKPEEPVSMDLLVMKGTSPVGGVTLPKYAGSLRVVDGFTVYSFKRSNSLHRFMMKFLLGWEWKDYQ